MTPEDQEKLKQLLLKDKARLEKEVKTLGSREARDFGEDTTYAAGEEDSDESEERVTHEAIREPLELRLKDINEALRKMDEGTYGKCEKCGKEIS
ncbi:MAG: hypothetical protein HYS89_01435 [Candidatus Colwellbacteria bacterium]|nr:hypothetical protein [Candidatus Colwellbacteria bacterium]